MEPHTEDCILAGPTPPAAVARFRMAVRTVTSTHDIYFRPCGRRHILGSIRIAPPLLSEGRYRAFVNWWPVGRG